VDALIPEVELQEAERWSALQIDRPLQTLLQVGSGWGALAQHELAQGGEGMLLSPGLPFDDASLGSAQRPWLALLNGGAFPDGPPQELATNFVVGSRWRRRLEGAVASGKADNWSGWYHLGIMRFCDAEKESARIAWERSLAHAVAPWALRNLALLAAEDSDLDEASSRYREALQLAPALRPLAVEAGRLNVDAGKPEKWLAILPELTLPLRSEGRLRLLEAQAAIAAGKTEVVAQFFAEAPTVADLREGEMTLETLWSEWQAREIAHEAELQLEEARRLARRERPVPPDL
jgi:hypothetical protein